jgi:ABC-type phosphate/phosphonate transport system substrate-binding protein
MRRNATCPLLVLLIVTLLASAGCRSGGIPLLNLFGVGKPLVVALVADERASPSGSPLDLLNPFAPYEPLRKALSEHAGRQVALDLCLPIQVKPNLGLGFYHLAVISPIQYGQLGDRQRFHVIAVSADEQRRSARSGLLLVRHDSDVRAVEDLRGKKVAFGPASDARTHHAGLELLQRSGLAKKDLALELLPIPGSLRHFSDARLLAQSVLNGSCDAGFMDEQAWEALPEHEVRAGEPARDQLRVVAKTLAVPNRLIVCSPKLPEDDEQKIRGFLLAAAQDHPDVLRPLRISGYQEPSAELLDVCRRLVERRSSAPESPDE